MQLISELEALVNEFDSAGVSYALCGGLAMAVHGHARATEDIDVLVQEGSLPLAKAAADRAGFSLETGWLEFRSGTPQEQRIFRLLKPGASGSIVLDLLIVNRALESTWRSRQQFQRNGRTLSVVSTDGLIEMKRLSGRQRDLSDIERMEAGGDEQRP